MEGTRRVLLVDDDPAVLRTVARFLRDWGFDVTAVASGAEALQRIAASGFDVAIVDQALGAMDGTALIQRAHQVAPRLRYLVFTGAVDFQITPALASCGVGPEDVLYKPLRSLQQATAAIERLLEAPRVA